MHTFTQEVKMLATKSEMKTQRWLFFTAQLETFPVMVPVKIELTSNRNHWPLRQILARTSENKTRRFTRSHPSSSPGRQAPFSSHMYAGVRRCFIVATVQ